MATGILEPVIKKATHKPPIADIPLIIPVIAPAMPTLSVEGLGFSLSLARLSTQMVTRNRAIRICKRSGLITARIETPMIVARKVPMDSGNSSL